MFHDLPDDFFFIIFFLLLSVFSKFSPFLARVAFLFYFSLLVFGKLVPSSREVNIFHSFFFFFFCQLLVDNVTNIATRVSQNSKDKRSSGRCFSTTVAI